jgi:hypothetical protein
MTKVLSAVGWIVALAAIHMGVALAADKKTLEERVADLETRSAALEKQLAATSDLAIRTSRRMESIAEGGPKDSAPPASEATGISDLTDGEKAVLATVARTFNDGITLSPAETVSFRQVGVKIDAVYGVPFVSSCVAINAGWQAAVDEWKSKTTEALRKAALDKLHADPRFKAGEALKGALETADVAAAVAVIRGWKEAK